jgi:hypothetical protein
MPTTGAAERWGTVARRLLILVALYAAPSDIVLRPITTPDLWWHLRTGQWVVENRTVPDTDPFSAYGHDRPWVAYSWLFEVVLYGLYSAFGLCGVAAYRVALGAVILIALHRFISRREPRFVRATFLTAVGFYALYPALIQERPWLFTILFTLWTLEAILRLRDGTATRAVWLLPLAYVVWANVHIQFVYGLALLGLGCAAPVIDWITSPERQRGRKSTPRWRSGLVVKMVALTAACAAATLVNPYGARVYGVVVEYATQPAPYELIIELKAPTFRLPIDWVILALGAAAVYTVGRRGRPSAFDLLLLAGTAYLAFRATRDGWFLAVASLAVLTARPRSGVAPAERFTLSPARVAVVAAGAALFMFLYAHHYVVSERSYQAEVARLYPAGAVAYLKDHPHPGPLFNEDEWGGYVMLFLPDYLVGFDGRTNLHGDDRLVRNVMTTRGLDWEHDPDLTGARLVMLANTRPLRSILDREPRFRKVYEDSVATVFINEEPSRARSGAE